MKELKKEKEESQWDKKKIIFFVLISLFLVAAGYGLKSIILPESFENQNYSYLKKSDVKGASDVRKNVQEQINNLKNEAQNIDLVDIATSSPQVQKVINDLKAIQDYPKNQLKETCEKICNGL